MRVRDRKGEATIRQLAPGDPIPAGEPRRYMSGDGYWRLRWKVAPGSYVETYEHRLVVGLPDGDVHHIDGDKTNNDPANLLVTSRSTHARLHGAEIASRARARRQAEWDGQRSRSAYEKRQRRLARERAREEFVREIVRLRQSGLTTIAIGRIVGRDNSNVTRALQDAERRYGIRYLKGTL